MAPFAKVAKGGGPQDRGIFYAAFFIEFGILTSLPNRSCIPADAALRTKETQQPN